MHRRLFVPALAATAASAATAAAQPPRRVPAERPHTRGGATSKTTAPGVVAPVVSKAVCVLMPVGDNEVSGTLYFERVDDTTVKVTGEVTGLTPGDHGFHVHQFGDVTDMASGKSAGGHMDVGEHKHGKPSDAERHTGDLGNITADENGVAKVDMRDDVISLNGAHSVVGRGFIVHADPDDFGQPTGNAGPRVAIGVIGIAQDGLK